MKVCGQNGFEELIVPAGFLRMTRSDFFCFALLSKFIAMCLMTVKFLRAWSFRTLQSSSLNTTSSTQ